MDSHIFKVINDKKGQPKAIVVASVDPVNVNIVSIGWSVKHKNDKFFDKELGLKIALNRSVLTSESVPHSIYDEVASIYHRSKSYFKNKEILIPSGF